MAAPKLQTLSKFTHYTVLGITLHEHKADVNANVKVILLGQSEAKTQLHVNFLSNLL